MKRALLCVVTTAVVAALAWAGPAVSSDSIYRINFNVRLGNAIPTGAQVTCKARIVPELAAGRPGLPAPMAGTATGVGTVTGSMAHCTVELPSTWAAADAHRAAVMNYEIDAKTPGAMHAVTGEGMELPPPPVGGAERLDLNVTL
jgi:hypothetical protein